MGAIFSNNSSSSTNTPAPLSNFRGAFATIAEILAIENPVSGDFAIFERVQPLSDVFYDYDVSFGSWRARPGEDFKGYVVDLDALIVAFPNPQPDWIAVNNADRSIKYIVFNGNWIEEPDTLDAAYVEQLFRNFFQTFIENEYGRHPEFTSQNQLNIYLLSQLNLEQLAAPINLTVAQSSANSNTITWQNNT